MHHILLHSMLFGNTDNMRQFFVFAILRFSFFGLKGTTGWYAPCTDDKYFTCSSLHHHCCQPRHWRRSILWPCWADLIVRPSWRRWGVIWVNVVRWVIKSTEEWGERKEKNNNFRLNMVQRKKITQKYLTSKEEGLPGDNLSWFHKKCRWVTLVTFAFRIFLIILPLTVIMINRMQLNLMDNVCLIFAYTCQAYICKIMWQDSRIWTVQWKCQEQGLFIYLCVSTGYVFLCLPVLLQTLL